ncbi:MAG: glycosyltransferase, partial [Pseudomonadota bacterium]
SGPATDEYMRLRETVLLSSLDIQPDVLITELFPFGRRTLRHEFGALLRANDAPVLASIRDILAPPSKPTRAAWTDTVLGDHYAGVLVHSDPDIVPLSASWPVSDRLRPLLHYTGFVAPPAPTAGTSGHGEVIVSAGGGPVGAALVTAAKQAAFMDPSRQWRCLVKDADPDNTPPNMCIEAPRADFRSLLMNAAASVSMCGYNTALDILQTGVPAVVVPFDAGGEVEQSLRAAALRNQVGLTVLPTANLSAAALITCLDTIGPRRDTIRQGMDGAMETVKFAEALVARA